MSKYNPVIVVVAYNRPHSLERLLFSLKNAKKIVNAKLIISIDNKEPDNLNVKQIADAFEWPFGEKEVIYQNQRLGLRKHILQCGGFASKYGSVIILEDDLLVSPFFYDYTVQALDYYDNSEQVGGISLYSQPREEICQLPFIPVTDDADIYFMQFPSSWGQAWTKKQWEKFKEWYENKPDISNIAIPDKILSWPETSWKKYFCAYLFESNKLFVFPRLSLTTNFNDPGTHLKLLVDNEGQTPLRIFDTEYRFKTPEMSLCKYDVYFEIMPDCIMKITNRFNNYSFEMDLYGMKNLAKVRSPYIITSRPTEKPLVSFKRALKPHEMNIIFDLAGNDFCLCETKNVKNIKKKRLKKIADYQYYYYKELPSIKLLIYNFISTKLGILK